MKAITKSLDDRQLQSRVKALKKALKKTDKNYIDFGNYYISLRKEQSNDGIRWFHRGKYKVEVVFNRESGPAQNVAPWALFSNIDDALLHAVLAENREIYLLELPKR